MAYTDDCWRKLIARPAGEIVIATAVSSDRVDDFKDAVKFFIDTDQGKEHGFQLEFSNDYSKVRKYLTTNTQTL